MKAFDSFPYSQATIDELERVFSRERLSTYVRLAAGDRAAAIRLQAWNIALSDALYGPIQMLEVALRNAIHGRLTNAFGDAWYDSCTLNETELHMLEDAKDNLNDPRKRGTPSHVISSLSFGFWLSLLGGWHENDLWRPHLHQAFPHAPRPLLRKQVYGPIHQVRLVRNRIAHHEPIVRRPGAWVDLENDHALIISMISWLSPIAADWTRHHSRFEDVWMSRPI